MTTFASSPLSEADHRAQLCRAVIASTVGTAIEWYFAVGFVARPLGAAIFGHLSDRIGRKRMYLIGSVVTGVFGFIYFALLNTGMPSWIFIAIVLSFVPHDLMYGPQAALIAAPLIATALLAAFGSGYVIAVYILFCAIVSVVATVLLPDYTNRDISEEHA